MNRVFLMLVFSGIQIVAFNNYCFSQSNSYKLVRKTNSLPGDVDPKQISRLNEPLKGLAALYSAMGGSGCSGDYCDLTTALGLGKQGSDKHKSLIKKYLPGDSLANFLIRQDCYLRPDGASSFNDYAYLTINVSGDTVRVNYKLCVFSHGDQGCNEALDVYVFSHKIFKKINRDDKWIRPK